MILKNSMLNKKINHNHKEDLECISGLLLKLYHKTSKFVQIVHYPVCTLLEEKNQTIKHVYQYT